MAGTHGHEKVGGEVQLRDALDLVQEDDHRRPRVRQDQLPEEFVQALLRRQRLLLLPPVLQVDGESEVPDDPVGDAVIPAPGLALSATSDGLPEVDDGREIALLAELARRPRGKARLAGLRRRQDMAVLPLTELLHELAIGRPLHVAAATRLHRAAHDIEPLAAFPRGHRQLGDRVALLFFHSRLAGLDARILS